MATMYADPFSDRRDPMEDDGFALPDDRLHAPHEQFHLPNFYQGIATAIWFLAEVGARRPLRIPSKRRHAKPTPIM